MTVKGSSEAFTYDYVFGPDENQSQVYDTAVTKIVGNIFKGYNVTILAYGQTGSGKTFSADTRELQTQRVLQVQLYHKAVELSNGLSKICFEG